MINLIKTYNKLVRDKIPEIIKNNNGIPKTKILNDIEYKKELEIKLTEEINEVLNSADGEKRLEELADVLEVVKSLAELEKNTLDDIIDLANKKREKRGGFELKIYLEEVDE